MKEKWRDVVGYEQTYQVSNLGKVKRITGGPSIQTDRILKQFLRDRNRKKYLCVSLSRKDKKPKKRQTHRLVLEAFVGQCPLGMECRHLDGNEHNNELNNLRWGTSQENAEDTVLHMKVACGVNLPQAKLNDSKIRQIRQLYTVGKWTHRQLAQKFDVSHYTIWRVVTRKTWKHIK